MALKAKCPKCNGNIFFERNTNYNYDKKQHEKTGWCLQCGYTVYMKVNVEASQQLSATANGK